MANHDTVVENNLGIEFDIGNIQAGKIRLKLGSGLAIAPDGTISATSSVNPVFELVDKTFAEGVVVNTGNNFNASTDVTTPYLFGSTVTPVGAGNDTRLYQVRFSVPHPDGDQYAPIVSNISNEPNGDEAIIGIIEGSINANGFDVLTSLGDNGGQEDLQVFLNFAFRVVEKVSVVTSI